MEIDKIPNTKILIDKIEYLYFSGTSYLGVSILYEFQEIVFKNIKKWGTTYGSSRNANIKLSTYRKTELYLSKFLKTEDCITVSSGTLAGLFAISALEKVVDSFFYMPKTHPAISPKIAQPVFVENSLNPLLSNKKEETICIVADAIATLETSFSNFDFLNKISVEKKVFFLIDESHSLGVLGQNGSGISSKIKGYKNIEIIGVSSLTKAYGISGGIIFGNFKTLSLVKENPLFIGSAAMNPAFLESFLEASSLYKNQLRKLKDNCKYIYCKIHTLEKITISKNYPVFFINDDNVADFLFSKGVIITNFIYPTIVNKKINRVVINANHTKEELDFLVYNLIAFLQSS